MRLSLVVPSLLWRQALGADERTLAAPGLCRLLADAIARPRSSLSPEDWLAERCGLVRDNDYPFAAVLALADDLPAHEGYWLLAEAVHFQIGHDDVIFQRRLGPLPQMEAQALLAVLNGHFAQDGWRFWCGASGRWYLSLSEAPALCTTAPRQALRRPVRCHLPQGRDARRWSRALTELQMLLFEHPVNRAREERGEAPLNSLWFWGGGAFPKIAPGERFRLVGGDALGEALAKTCGFERLALPALAHDLAIGDQDTVVWLDALDTTHATRDIEAWQTALLTLERNWFAPLTERAQAGEISALRLLAFSRDQMRDFEFRPKRGWRRFWPEQTPNAASTLARLVDALGSRDAA
ncbi:MAG: hypothetical protein HYZ17_02110 [Betaproteobacteria bacterium]|nr:hypothetical protein [Betaproteobacteria bacterium]